MLSTVITVGYCLISRAVTWASSEIIRGKKCKKNCAYKLCSARLHFVKLQNCIIVSIQSRVNNNIMPSTWGGDTDEIRSSAPPPCLQSSHRILHSCILISAAQACTHTHIRYTLYAPTQHTHTHTHNHAPPKS